MSKPTIIFMGTPEFGLISLEALWSEGYPIKGVFTQPDKPSGRGQKMTTPPCALFAKEKKLPLFQPASLKDEDVLKQIEELKADFIITAAYGKFLPDRVLKGAQIDTINVHPSLLPKYRGAAPVNWALIRGEKETGVTIMKTIQKMDAGPIYSQQKCLIAENDNAVTLSKKLAQIGAQLLIETISLIHSKKAQPIEQDESKMTLAPALKKEDGKINWNQDSEIIHNLIRGTQPWPSAYTLIDNKILKIYDSSVVPEKTANEPGTIYLLSPQGINVACKDSSICITAVQLEGKKKIQAADFVRGYRLKVGEKFD